MTTITFFKIYKTCCKHVFINPIKYKMFWLTDISVSAIQPIHLYNMNTIEFLNTNFIFPGNQEDFFGLYLYESDESLETITRYLQSKIIIHDNLQILKFKLY